MSMKKILGLLPLLLLPAFAHAQAALDVNINFGTAWDSASGAGIDNLNSNNALGGCIVNSGDPFCQATPKLSGFFLGFGGDIMLREHFGVGAEINFQPVHQDYGPLQSRQTFFDVNGIYAPIVSKRAILQLQGGIGTSTTGFIFNQNSCVGTAVCSNYASPVGSSTHFQLHFGVGVQIPFREHFFVRPQFDLHYVPNLTDQYGSDLVPEATIAVGYHFGSN